MYTIKTCEKLIKIYAILDRIRTSMVCNIFTKINNKITHHINQVIMRVNLISKSSSRGASISVVSNSIINSSVYVPYSSTSATV